jgi:ankyrin repeat protein
MPSPVEVIKALIDAGADVNVSDGYHGSALAFTGYWRREEVVRALLEAGADPFWVDIVAVESRPIFDPLTRIRRRR